MSYTLLEFDQLDSTNDFLKENHPYFPHMTIIRANHQLKGRGQFDRTWDSEANKNLLFSILLKQVRIDQSLQIKQWVLDTLVSFFNQYGAYPEFKEPNDLYIKDKKIAGILIETLAKENVFDVVIIGIGININQRDFHHLQATSLGNETNRIYDISCVFNSLLQLIKSTHHDFSS